MICTRVEHKSYMMKLIRFADILSFLMIIFLSEHAVLNLCSSGVMGEEAYIQELRHHF